MLGSNIIDDMCLNFELLDAYRKKHPTQRSYTCVSQHVSGQSQSRLDRIFIPRCLYNMCSSIVVSPVSFSDHLSIALHLRTDTKNRGPGYWKCNASILSDPNLRADIQWQAYLATASEIKDASWWEELKSSFIQTIRLHSVRLSNLRKNEIRSLEQQIKAATDDPKADTAHVNKIKNELEACISYCLEGDAMRAKIDTFNEELPQHVIKQRERSMGAKKRMNKLVTDSGVLTDTAAILNEATHFYSKLYSAEPVDESCIDYFLSDVKRMPDVFQSKCEASLTYGECMSAIGGMKSGKAP
jgi:hypothetical protein